MGYNKFIRSGNQLELYEYEKDLPIRRIKRTREILRRQSTGVRTFFSGSEESNDTCGEMHRENGNSAGEQEVSSGKIIINKENISFNRTDTLQQVTQKKQKK